MTITPSDIMRHIRNFFETSYSDADWIVENGHFSTSPFLPGHWIAIPQGQGPSGIYRLDEYGCLPANVSGAWQGRIWRLTPPADFLRLCRDIADWAESHPDPALESEHLGQYSRTLAGGGWQSAFEDALRPYTRMYTEVDV